MDRLVETWVTNHYETPYKCAIKTGVTSGADGEYDLLGLKTTIKTKTDDILHYIKKELGDKASPFTIANTLLEYLPTITYIEITMNGEDGVTIYKET